MAEELQTLNAAAAAPGSRKRKSKHNKTMNPRKRFKQKASTMSAAKPRKPDKKMRKLFRKRAREYNSDEEDEGDEEIPEEDPPSDEEEEDEGEKDLDAGDDGSGDSDGDDEDGEGVQHGITRFFEGCRAFKVAFMKIIKRHIPDDPLVSLICKVFAQFG